MEYDFEASIFYWICMTSRAFERALNEELAPHGITFQQWQVLGWLALEKELSQTQLAERLRVEAPTLVGILDRMERDGWITRTLAQGDRRRKIIRPTPRVEPIWDLITSCARRLRSTATKNLSPADLKRVMALLGQVQENLKDRKRPATAAKALRSRRRPLETVL